MEVSKIVKEKIFGLYYGSECQFDNGNALSKFSGSLLGYDYRFGYMLSNRNPIVPFKFCNPGYTKLILRSLEDITDGEGTTIARILGVTYSSNPDSEARFDLTGLAYYLRELFESGSDIRDITADRLLALIDKLREWGIMLPAFGIQDLFEAGVAVRNKTI